MSARFEDLPLEFTKDEMRRAGRLLVTAYSTHIAALTLAGMRVLDLALLNQMILLKFLMHDILMKVRSALLCEAAFGVILDGTPYQFNDILGHPGGGLYSSYTRGLRRKTHEIALSDPVPDEH